MTTPINCEAVRRDFPQFRDLTDAEITELVRYSEALLRAVLADLKARAATAKAA